MWAHLFKQHYVFPVMRLTGLVRRQLKRLCLGAALLFVATGLVSCSSGFVYQNLDWVIPWYLDDYVELNEQQQAQFDTVIEQALAWHKTEELPRYHQYLETVYLKLDQPLSEEDMAGIQTFASASFSSIQQRIVPELLPLSKTLDADQQADIWDELTKKQTEYEEEFLSRTDAEYVEELNEKYTKFLERFLGTLSEEQASIIAARVETIIRADDLWLRARQAWLNTIKREYEAQGREAEGKELEVEGADWLARMQATWLNRDQHYSKADKLTIDTRDQQARALLLAVMNTRSKEQSDHFKAFIRDWQAKFTRWQ